MVSVARGNCPCVGAAPRELDRPHCDRADPSCAAGPLLARLRPLEPHPSPIPSVPDWVRLDPSQLAPLYGRDFGHLFLLVTTPRVRAVLDLAPPAGFHVEELIWTGPHSRSLLIDTLQELRDSGLRTSVLWIVDGEFEHFLPEHLIDAKLAAISFFSGHFTRSNLLRYLSILTTSDYEWELALEARMVGLLDHGRRLLFRCLATGTVAVFDHHEASHWFSLHGPLDWGHQTVLPTGELSALADGSGDFTLQSRFSLNGELTLMGHPIVHRGNSEVTTEETDEMFRLLAPMMSRPVIATVRDGLIEAVRPCGEDEGLASVFEALFDHDVRYRKVHELGFGTSRAVMKLSPENFFPNERWPGLHCGLGLGGYTPFHLDLTCTALDVFVDRGDGDPVDIYRALGLHR